jgi:hypothetical protein
MIFQALKPDICMVSGATGFVLVFVRYRVGLEEIEIPPYGYMAMAGAVGIGER